MRQANIQRATAETKIKLFLDLDGKGESEVKTGVGFLNHMLTLFARHGNFDLSLSCHGDTEVDYHHTTEDIGICLGQAVKAALGERALIAPEHLRGLRADAACVLATARPGDWMEPARLTPIYLRAPQAERERRAGRDHTKPLRRQLAEQAGEVVS